MTPAAMEVDGDDVVDVEGANDVDGEGVDETTVGEVAPVPGNGGEESGDCDAGTDGGGEVALVEDDLFAGDDVGGYGPERNGEAGEVGGLEFFAKQGGDFLAFDESGAGQGGFGEEGEELFEVEVFGDVLEMVKFAGGEEASDEGPDAGSGDGDGLDVVFLECAKDAEVSPAACATASEGETDAGTGGQWGCLHVGLGCMEGVGL